MSISSCVKELKTLLASYIGDCVYNYNFRLLFYSLKRCTDLSEISLNTHIEFCMFKVKHYPRMYDYLEFLLSNRTEFNINKILFDCFLYYYGNIPLSCLQLLINHGANVNFINLDTASNLTQTILEGVADTLMYYCDDNIIEETRNVLDLLINNGLNMNLLNSKGDNCLQYIITNYSKISDGYQSIIFNLFLDYGVNYDCLDFSHVNSNVKEHFTCLFSGRRMKPANKA